MFIRLQQLDDDDDEDCHGLFLVAVGVLDPCSILKGVVAVSAAGWQGRGMIDWGREREGEREGDKCI